jgi:hypothetical protein
MAAHDCPSGFHRLFRFNAQHGFRAQQQREAVSLYTCDPQPAHWQRCSNCLYAHKLRETVCRLIPLPSSTFADDRKSRYPITLFLCWLHDNVEYKPSTFMIDCSDTEVAGIRAAYPTEPPTILFCYWHLLRAVASHLRTDVSISFISL